MFEAITDNIFFKIAVAVAAIFCVVTLLSSNAEGEELRAEREQLEEQIAECNEMILSLENDLSAPLDDDYVIRTAREKLNMRLPEEIVFITNIPEE